MAEIAELEAFRRRMQARAIDERAIQAFEQMYRSYRQGQTGKVPWAEVEQPGPGDIVPFEELTRPELEAEGQQELSRLVVIRLNGGLGTTMKLDSAKSLIRVRDGHSFLDLTVEQVLALRRAHRVQVPWLAMNSFRTRADTLAALARYPIAVADLPVDFVQNQVPRIDRERQLPLDAADPEAGWAPPGHGDIYLALWTSGLLERLLEAGYRWAFVANIDNLGATFHPAILGYLARQRLDFAMEVTDKSLADIKGGTLIRHQGRLALLESAQIEEGHLADFQDIKVFSVFNTNNLWWRLDAVLERMRSGGLGLPLIINPKKVEGREVVQLENAMGAAVGCFERSVGLRVPRDRFAPVKATSDLLAVRSDAYVLDPASAIRPNPARPAGLGPPIVRLDDRYYKGIDEFEERFPEAPSLLRCRSLSVEGDIHFGRKVRLEGEVRLRAAEPRRIPDHQSFTEGSFDL